MHFLTFFLEKNDRVLCDEAFNVTKSLNDDLILSPIKSVQGGSTLTNSCLNYAETSLLTDGEANFIQNSGNDISDLTELEQNISQTKNECLADIFTMARSFSSFTSSTNLAKRLNDLKDKLNNAQENIQVHFFDIKSY